MYRGMPVAACFVPFRGDLFTHLALSAENIVSSQTKTKCPRTHFPFYSPTYHHISVLHLSCAAMSDGAKGKLPVRYEMAPITTSEPGLVERRVAAFDVIDGLRRLVVDDDPTPRASSPATVLFPYESKAESGTPKPRQLSEGVAPVPRPTLKRKAATAPPGALHLFATVPQPPRRAISARTTRPGRSHSSRNGLGSRLSAPLPRISVFGTPASRSPISKRKSIRKPVGRLGLKPKGNVWRLSPPPSLKRRQLISEALDERRKGSFSGKARVRETLRSKEVEFLETNIVDFNARDLPQTPGSMGSTPRELYGRTSPSGSNSRPIIRRALQPTSSNKARHFSLSQRLDVQPGEGLPRIASSEGTFHEKNDELRSTQEILATRQKDQWSPALFHHMQHGAVLHSNSTSALRSTNNTACRRRVYIPGPIRLVDNVDATPRRDSAATLEPFASHMEGRAKRSSDQVAEDDVVAYFQGLGVIDEASEDGLDRFWESEMETSRIAASPPEPTTAVPPLPDRPPVPSLPSSSSTPHPVQRAVRQQDEKITPSSPSPRQRIKLRRLLNSATSLL